MLMDIIDERTAIAGEERARMAEYIVDIQHKIEIPKEEQKNDSILAQQIVDYICPHTHQVSDIFHCD